MLVPRGKKSQSAVHFLLTSHLSSASTRTLGLTAAAHLFSDRLGTAKALFIHPSIHTAFIEHLEHLSSSQWHQHHLCLSHEPLPLLNLLHSRLCSRTKASHSTLNGSYELTCARPCLEKPKPPQSPAPRARHPSASPTANCASSKPSSTT